jgi:OOP family OmpA-OmpF porin
VIGYSDRVEASENQHLAEQCAAVVRDYLIAKGIDSKRIYWEGRVLPQSMAALCARIMERTQLIDGLAPDRRVTIEVVGKIPKPLQRRSPGNGA